MPASPSPRYLWRLARSSGSLAVHPGVDDVDGERHVLHRGHGERREGGVVPPADGDLRGRLLRGRQHVGDAVAARRHEGVGQYGRRRLRRHARQLRLRLRACQHLRAVPPELHVTAQLRTAQKLTGRTQTHHAEPHHRSRRQRLRPHLVREQREVRHTTRPGTRREHDRPRVQIPHRPQERRTVRLPHTQRPRRTRHTRHHEVRDLRALQRVRDQTQVVRRRTGRREPVDHPAPQRHAVERHLAHTRVGPQQTLPLPGEACRRRPVAHLAPDAESSARQPADAPRGGCHQRFPEAVLSGAFSKELGKGKYSSRKENMRAVTSSRCSGGTSTSLRQKKS